MKNIKKYDEYKVFKKRRNLESQFYFYGRNISFKLSKFKMRILWHLPSIRTWSAKKAKDRIEKKLLIGKFMEGWIDGGRLNWIFCDICGKPGFDFDSDSHGWTYHGGHLWTCKKCGGKSEKIVS